MNKPHKPTHRLRARTVIDCETGFMCLVAGCWWLHKQAWQVSNEACQVRVLTRATVPQLSWTVPINMQAKSTHKSSKTNNMRLFHLHSTHQELKQIKDTALRWPTLDISWARAANLAACLAASWVSRWASLMAACSAPLLFRPR